MSWIAIGMALALATGQAAQDPAAESLSTQDAETPVSEEIVVTAMREKAMADLVADISQETSNDQLARWDRKICPAIIGMKKKPAEYMADRLALAAYSLGLDVGEPGCRPNVLIFGTADSQALVKQLVADQPLAFDKFQETGKNNGRKALKAFIETPRPVRWWHVTREADENGMKIDAGGTVTVRSVGRLKANTRDDFDRAIVIVDFNLTKGAKLQAIADYVAMITLAQVAPDAQRIRANSILNLFDPNAPLDDRPVALTEWDQTYLKGLYDAERMARNSKVQRRTIVDRLRRPSAEKKQ